MLLLCGGNTRRIVTTLSARHRVDGANRVVVNRAGGDSVVIVMRSDQDVFGRPRRIRAGEDGNDIARRDRTLSPPVVPQAGYRPTFVAVAPVKAPFS